VPILSLLLTLVAFSSIGLPGLNGFIGEFLVLLGSYGRYPWATGIATTVVIFAAAYLLWAIGRMIYGKVDKPENETMHDLSLRELIVLAPLVLGIVWMGLYPAPLLRRTEGSARQLIEYAQPGRSSAINPAGVEVQP
jgi:NADH-quinone oxidoreductase subunit M